MRYSVGDLVWIKKEKKLTNEINKGGVVGVYSDDNFVINGHFISTSCCGRQFRVKDIEIKNRHCVLLVENDEDYEKFHIPVEAIEEHTAYNTITLLCYALNVQRYEPFSMKILPDGYNNAMFMFSDAIIEMKVDDDWKLCDLSILYFLDANNIIKLPEDKSVFYVPSLVREFDTFVFEKDKNLDEYRTLTANNCLFSTQEDAKKKSKEIKEKIFVSHDI